MNSYNGFSGAQRLRALAWAKKGYAAGTRSRAMACDACGQAEGVLDRHSEDYSEPFGPHIGAYGLCYCCHMMIHCRFRAPDPWRAYREAVAGGATFPPFRSRDFPTFARLFLGGTAANAKGVSARFPEPARRPPPAERVLDDIEQGNLRRAA